MDPIEPPKKPIPLSTEGEETQDEQVPRNENKPLPQETSDKSREDKTHSIDLMTDYSKLKFRKPAVIGGGLKKSLLAGFVVLLLGSAIFIYLDLGLRRKIEAKTSEVYHQMMKYLPGTKKNQKHKLPAGYRYEHVKASVDKQLIVDIKKNRLSKNQIQLCKEIHKKAN